MPKDTSLESLPTDMLGLPEVILDGHKVAPGSEESLAETLNLVNMANIQRMRRLMEDRTPRGIIYPYTLTVLPAIEEIILPTPGQSISVSNDGPAAIQIGLNDRINFSTINVNQPFSVNFEAHKLVFFEVRCAPGLTSSVRILVKA